MDLLAQYIYFSALKQKWFINNRNLVLSDSLSAQVGSAIFYIFFVIYVKFSSLLRREMRVRLSFSSPAMRDVSKKKTEKLICARTNVELKITWM